MFFGVAGASRFLQGKESSANGAAWFRHVCRRRRKPSKCMESRLKTSYLTLGFPELLDRSSRVSVRLSNAVKRAAAQQKIPYRTVGAYLNDGEFGRHQMSRIENLGRKSIAELELLIAEASLALNHSDDVGTSTSAHNLTEAEVAIPEFLGQFFGVNPLLVAAVEDAVTNGELPFSTVKEYLEAGDSGRERMLALHGITHDLLLKFDHVLAESGFLYSRIPIDNNPSVESQITEASAISGGDPKASCEELLGLSIMEFVDKYGTRSRDLRSDIASLAMTRPIPFKTVGDYVNTTQRFEKFIAGGLGKKSALAFERLVRTTISSTNDNSFSVPSNAGGYPDIGVTMHEVLSLLDNRQKSVIVSRFFEKRTLEDVAADSDVTRERVRQIEASAIRKIAVRFGKALIGASQDIQKKFEAESICELPLEGFSRLVSSEQKDAAVFVSLLTRLDGENALFGIYGAHVYVRSQFANRKSWKAELAREMAASALLMNRQEALATIKAVPGFFIDEYFHRKWGVSPNDDEASTYRLKTSYMCVDVLKKANRPLHTSDVRARIYEKFQVDVEEHAISATLGRLREVIIFAPGTYVLYDSLPYSQAQIERVRNVAHSYLTGKGVFLSSKILFEEVFEDRVEEFPDLGHYVVMGILQDDKRFVTKRGNMIGLASFDVEEAYTPLQDEIVGLVLNHGPISLQEIAARLSETRRLCNDSGIRQVLSQSPEIIQTGKRTYDSLHRFFEDRASYDDLLLAIRLSLLGRRKTTYALCQDLEKLGRTDVSPQLLLSLISSMEDVETDSDIHYLSKIDGELEAYDDAVASVLPNSRALANAPEIADGVLPLERVRKLQALDARFLTNDGLDASATENTELGSILKEFGF